MADILTATPPVEDVAYYQQAIAECFAEMDRLRQIMIEDQIKIDRSQAETTAMLAEINTALANPTRRAA